MLSQLTDAFRGVEQVSTSAAASAREASETVRARVQVAGSFSTSSDRLRMLAERMRQSLGSYSTTDDGPPSTERPPGSR